MAKSVVVKVTKKLAATATALIPVAQVDVGGVRCLFVNLPPGALFTWPHREGIHVKWSPNFFRRLNSDGHLTQYLNGEEMRMQVYHINEHDAEIVLLKLVQ